MDDQHEMERKVGTCKMLASYLRESGDNNRCTFPPTQKDPYPPTLSAFLHVNGEPPRNGEATPERRYAGGNASGRILRANAEKKGVDKNLDATLKEESGRSEDSKGK